MAPGQPSQSSSTSVVNHAPTPFTAGSSPTVKQHPSLTQGVKIVKNVKFPSSSRLSRSPGRANSFSERLTISPLDRHYNTPRYFPSPRVETDSVTTDEQDSYLAHTRAKILDKETPQLSLSNRELSSGLTTENLGISSDTQEMKLPTTTSTEVESASRTMEGVWSSGANTERMIELVNMAPFPKLRVLSMCSNLVSQKYWRALLY